MAIYKTLKNLLAPTSYPSPTQEPPNTTAPVSQDLLGYQNPLQAGPANLYSTYSQMSGLATSSAYYYQSPLGLLGQLSQAQSQAQAAMQQAAQQAAMYGVWNPYPSLKEEAELMSVTNEGVKDLYDEYVEAEEKLRAFVALNRKAKE